MANFLNIEDVPMRTRRPHLDRYRKQLRDGLLNPVLTKEQRGSLRAKLALVGKTKPYIELARVRGENEESG